MNLLITMWPSYSTQRWQVGSGRVRVVTLPLVFMWVQVDFSQRALLMYKRWWTAAAECGWCPYSRLQAAGHVGQAAHGVGARRSVHSTRCQDARADPRTSMHLLSAAAPVLSLSPPWTHPCTRSPRLRHDNIHTLYGLPQFLLFTGPTHWPHYPLPPC